MVDPLTETVALLKPRAVFTKGISGAGAWAVRYTDFGHPSFCTVLEGGCRLIVQGAGPLTLEAGDFVLLPSTPGFIMSSFTPATPRTIDPKQAATPGEDVRHGDPDGPPDVRLLGGYFIFDSPDSGLLASRLPEVVHMRDTPRLSTLVRFVADEAQTHRPGRDLILSRLIEVVLVETLRSLPPDDAPPGLLRALADTRMSAALRSMHGEPARAWTTSELARTATLSRSAFFDRFSRTLGVAPMAYLLNWRMALAKDLLRSGGLALSQIAERVGYSSASTFSTAFSKHVGDSPGRYARRAAGRSL